jgi:hypothetical protein
LVDLVAGAGPTPHGVDQITHIIASVPAGPLSRAAREAVPSYEQLMYDKEKRGGELLKYMEENPTPEISLGSDIRLRQQELSRPTRRLATLACFLALFAGGGYATRETYKAIDTGALASVRNDSTQHLEGEAIVGGVAGAAGGFIAYFTALGLAGRLARRPAQKIVRGAEESPTE